jgi:alkylation response protein AidB-like acyl-CoA dehydrogenase
MSVDTFGRSFSGDVCVDGLVLVGEERAARIAARAASSDEEFRAEFRAFLKANHPGKAPKDRAAAITWQKAFNALLVDAGWAAPSWPVAYGGMDLAFDKQVVYTEEFARANVPSPLGTGVGIVGPTIIQYGTEDQKQRWLSSMLRNDEVWAQGYSEPEAGSDLPSLRTTAVLDGDEYIVNGQKIWSSGADRADKIFTLVRTGTQEDRHNGITYLIIDAHSPGITIRAINDMSGGAHFSEIFFDNVRVPATERIGEENKGWGITRTSLGHERAAGAYQQATRYRRILNELIEMAQEQGRNHEPVLRQDLARLVIWQRILEYSGMRTINSIVEHGEPGPQSSVSRLSTSLFEQWIHVVAVDLLGPYGQLDRRDSHSVQRGRWTWGFLRTRASTIGAGTAEIQRNTAAERVLGLPHEPDAFTKK